MPQIELPEDLILAPCPITSDITPGVRTLAVYGRTLERRKPEDLANVETLWVSGMPTKICPLVGSLTRLKKLVIHGLSSPDLSWASRLRGLVELGLAGPSRLKSLSGIEVLSSLQSLSLFGVMGIEDLTPVARLTSLRRLSIEGGDSKSLLLKSVEPLSHLVRLESLRLASLRTIDGKLGELQSLHALRSVFVTAQFSEKERTMLAKALPLAAGMHLDELRR